MPGAVAGPTACACTVTMERHPFPPQRTDDGEGRRPVIVEYGNGWSRILAHDLAPTRFSTATCDRLARRCLASVRAVYFAPSAKRVKGPKATAEASPTK